VQAADTGVQFPPLKVMAGGALYIGYVGTKAQREEALKAGWSEYLFDREKPRRRNLAEEVYARATTQGPSLPKSLAKRRATPWHY
jgi:hypothetical protein